MMQKIPCCAFLFGNTAPKTLLESVYAGLKNIVCALGKIVVTGVCLWVLVPGFLCNHVAAQSNQTVPSLTAINTATIPVGNEPDYNGTFIPQNDTCPDLPQTFAITVNPPDTIIASAAYGSISACVGNASISPLLQQFSVSGVSLTGDITAAAPTGFEVSLSATSGFGGSVTIPQNSGAVDSVVVYVRSAASASTGGISGNVVLSSPGAASVNVAVNGVVNALPSANSVPNQTAAAGANTTAVNFTGTANTYTWAGSTLAIGLATSGSGNIAPFTALNNTTSPIIDTITATPVNALFLYTTNQGNNSVSVINTTTDTTVATIPTTSTDLGLTVSPDGSTVYVANFYSNTISVINAANNQIIHTIASGGNPSGISTSPDGSKLYVANQGDNTVSVFSTATYATLATITVGGFNTQPVYALASPDGSKVYVANDVGNSLSVINALTNTVITTVAIPSGSCWGLALTPDGSKLYVGSHDGNSISVVNTATNTLITTIGGFSLPKNLVVSPDGKTLYVSNGGGNTITVVNVATNTVVTNIGVDTGPYNVQLTPDGSKLYVEDAQNGTVQVISTATNSVIKTIAVGSSPATVGDNVTPGASCPGTPITFTITVNPPDTITATAAYGSISACAGNASASPLLQQFSVSGVSLTGNITAIAPSGFEVSLSATSGFGGSVTIPQASGSVDSVVVYVRSAAADAAGNISGNVVLSSPGAANINVAVSGVINALPTASSVPNQTVAAGATTAAVSFTGTANTYAWAGSTLAIGLATSGSGNIAPFTALNNTTSPIIDTITATPVNARFLYTTNQGNNSVSVINTTTDTTVATIPTTSSDLGLTVSPDGSTVYVANFNSNTISVINAATNQIIHTIASGGYPSGISTSPDGSKLYVANQGDNNVSVFNTATYATLATITVGGSNTLPVYALASPDGSKVYVANYNGSSLSVINALTNTVITTVAIPSGSCWGLALTPDGSRLYVGSHDGNSISVINTATNTVITTIGGFSLPKNLVVSPDGKTLYVSNAGGNSITVVNVATNTVVTNIGVDSGPYNVQLTPDGSKLYVEDAQNGTVQVISTATNSVIKTIAVGPNPATIGDIITPGASCPGTPIAFTITVCPVAKILDTAIAICAGGTYTLPSGRMLNSSGLYIDTVRFVVTGCDSLITNLTLTVQQLKTADTSVTICAGQTYAMPSGKTVSITGMYNDTVHYVTTGCDSLVTQLNLSVLASKTVDTSVAICAGQTYTLPSGKTANTTGVYNDTVSYLITGCDSLITVLNLNVLPSASTVNTSATICAGQTYTLPSGKTENTSGVYNDTLFYHSTGCDSLITITNLTVLPAASLVNTTATICAGQTYTLPSGKTENTSGVYNDTLFYHSTGCDSLITITDLTVLPAASSVNTSATICAGQTYTLPSGKTVNATGVYSDTLHYTSTGCDSLVTVLNLTVLPAANTVNTSAAICAGQTYTLPSGKTVNTTGVYSDTLFYHSTGCDSLITITNLTVLPAANKVNTSATICAGQTSTLPSGKTENTSGLYNDTLFYHSTGCDSLITVLNLTVLPAPSMVNISATICAGQTYTLPSGKTENTTGVYNDTVHYASTGCDSLMTVLNLTVLPAASTVNTTATICAGQTYTLPSGKTDNATGVYNDTLYYHSTGCDSLITVLNLTVLPAANAVNTSATICAGQTYTLPSGKTQNTSGLYNDTLFYHSTGCDSLITVLNLTVLPAASLVNTSATICAGQTYTLPSGKTENTSGLYNDTLFYHSTGCDSLITVLNLTVLPAASLVNTSATICAGQTSTLPSGKTENTTGVYNDTLYYHSTGCDSLITVLNLTVLPAANTVNISATICAGQTYTLPSGKTVNATGVYSDTLFYHSTGCDSLITVLNLNVLPSASTVNTSATICAGQTYTLPSGKTENTTGVYNDTVHYASTGCDSLITVLNLTVLPAASTVNTTATICAGQTYTLPSGKTENLTGVYNDTLFYHSTGCDSLITVLNLTVLPAASTVNTSATICAGQTYTLPSGKTQNTSGLYNDTLFYHSTGCDSLITVLNLTVLPAPSMVNISATICAGQTYTLPSGKTENTTGVYNDTVHYASTGCDSLMTVLNLTVLPAASTVNTTATICAGQTYTLPSGKTENVTGVYNDTLFYHSTGCDSLITVLNLTVLPVASLVNTSATICAGQTSTLPSGKTENTSGLYNDTLFYHSTGCDSLITVLNLTVLPAPSMVNISATICAGQTYTLPSGKTENTTGVYNDTVHYASTGCDSLMTVLNLTVLPAASTVNTTATICAGQTYTLPSGKTENVTGVYNDTLFYHSTGCDSLITVLNLTVLPVASLVNTSATICAGQTSTLPSGKTENTSGLYNDTLFYHSTGCDSLITVLNLTVLPSASTVNTSATICAGQTYTLPSGKTDNATGVYNDTLYYHSTGCDSLITVLNLTVLPAASLVNTSATICAGQTSTLPSGKTENTSGLYNDTLFYHSTGCDSLITVLNLTVLPAPSMVNISATICAGQTYTLPSGKTENTSGLYNDTLFYHSTGCDSLITVLNLTVLPAANTVNISATICAGQTYTLPSGKTENTSGVYNDTLYYHSTGCDSLITITNLTVLPAASLVNTTATICAGQTYTLPSGKTENTSGVYNDTLFYHSTGCDSLITITDLTVLPAASSVNTSATICAGQTYTLPSGKTVNATGVYSDTLHYTSTGCDSLVTVLNLTVLPAANTVNTSAAICAGQTYTLPSGKTVNTTGVYSDTLFYHSTGCDSLITITNLTVLPAANKVNTSATICAGQTSTLPSGKTENTSGLYNDTLFYHSTGCDSLITVLNLTVLPAPSMVNISATICAGQTYTLPSGKTENTTGVYNDTVHYASTGCDSLMTVLNLTVLPAASTVNTTATICAGQTYTLPSGKTDNATGVYNDTLYYHSTGCDSLITVLNLTVLPAANAVNTSATICAGQTYTLPSGKTQNTSGLYNDTLFYHSTGCDSLITVLNLTVLPAASLVNTSATICAGQTYTLPSGKTENTSGLYNDTLFYHSTGCDSLITVLNLTVLPAASLVNTSATICAGQTSTLPSGKTENTTGVYNDTLYYHSTGCDSLITITNLTVLPAANKVNTSATICAGQTSTLPSGKTENTSGLYNDTLFYHSTGCDSLITVLNLTVLPAPSMVNISATICAGQTYTLPSGKTENTTGVYNDTVHYASTGCDSLMTVLNLTVLPAASTVNTTATICAGQTYTLPSGKTDNATGVYNDTLYYHSTGCDSLITVLNLTVLPAANAVNTSATICAGQTYTLPSGKTQNTSGLYNDTLFYHSTGCDSLITVLNLTVLPAASLVNTSATICAGQTYTLPSGKTENTSGLYNDTLFYHSTGCDSLITVLNLTVLPAASLVNTSATICAGQTSTLPSGKTENTTGVYNDTLYYHSTGCDSLITVLNLTVLPAANTVNISATICAGQTYTLPSGKTVNATGVYSDTLFYHSTGCDSLITITNLTVLPAANKVNTSATICAVQTYTLPSGKTATATGVYNDTLFYHSTGCDSLITMLNLTVLSTASTVNTSATICASQTYTLPSGKIVNATGVYNDTLHYISTGCDSLVTVLNLTVLPAGNTTDTSVTICAGQTYTLPSGKTDNATGVYNDTLYYHSTGCDSLITVLKLTVLPAANAVNTSATICAGQTYTLPSGKTENTSGVYNDTLFYHSTGCDSLITVLNLTVLPAASTVNTSATICAGQTYTLPSGKTENTSGLYNDTLFYHSTGCDSLITVLNLTVLPAASLVNTSATICAGQAYSLPSGKTANATGIYNDTVHYTSTSCDSLVTVLNLTVLPAASMVNTIATICAGQTYTLPSGKTATATGVYNDTLFYHSTGCDSLITMLNLTVLSTASTVNTSATICASQTYTLPSGKIVNATGVYNDTLHYTSTGCDSLVTVLNLTVLPAGNTTDTSVTICAGQSYTLPSGKIVNTTGVYNDTVHYISTGCDSLVTVLNLTVLPAGNTTDTSVIICAGQSYTLPSGKIVNTPGVYNDTVHYISTGCDSLITMLNLTVLSTASTVNTSAIICAGQTYTLPSGKTVNSMGVYNDTVHYKSTGCDSLITVLNLTVLSAANIANTNATICAGQTYTLPSGKIVNTTGVYNDTLHYTSTGCDSLVTFLNLTVLPAGNTTDTSVIICAGQSYTLPTGKIVNTTGIYNDTVHYISTGCDSLVTFLNLTVLPAGNTTDTSVIICAGQAYTLPTGKIVNTTGIYNDTLHYTSTGCDSLVTVLNLTVLPAGNTTDTSVTICAGQSYTLPSGKIVNTPGIYNDTLHYTSTDCDSLVTVLNLTVLPAGNTTDTSVTICAGQSYTLPSGKTVNSMGVYNDTVHYISTGCDSLVTVLNLTVLPAGNTTDTSVTICAGQSYTLPSGKTVNTTGVYNDTVHYISTGCDSLVTFLNLTVLPAGNTTDTSVTICASHTYTLPSGKIVNATGVYNDTLFYHSTGCDSLITVLNLTVLPAASTVNTSATICAGQTYTLPSGKIVDTTGGYNDTVYYAATGCDSLITVLNLTVLSTASTVNTSAIICAGQTYTLPSGKTVNATGIYNDTVYYTSTGCDSLVTVLNLTVLPAASMVNTIATICAGQTYTLPSGKTATATGVYNDTLFYHITGCDSLITVLNLTVLSTASTVNTSAIICAGQTYTLPSGKIVNTTGVYNDTLHYTSTGCDSLVTVLNLTVLPAGNTTDTSVTICAGQSYTLPSGKIVNTTGVYNDTVHYTSTGCDSLVTVLNLTVLPAGNITDTSVIICAGQSYALPSGKTVNTTGVYNDTLHYISTGCDSLVTVLNLTVLPAASMVNTIATICAGQAYTLPSGKTATATGVYNDTSFYHITGCDSLITMLNLTVLSTASTVNTSATICASQTYTLPSGKTVNATGVYSDTLHYTSTGCDSLVTVLNLTVLPAGNTTDTSVIICAGQSYTLPSGKIVNTPGIYNDTLHYTSTGCDSLVTVLNLTVLPAGNTTDTSVTICAGQSYTLPSGKIVNTTGVYNDTLHYTSTGCDSLVTVLNLTVLPAGNTTDTSVIICAGQSYTLPSGKIVNTPGVYNDTLHYTSTGCDSLVTVLNLTVLPAGNTTDTSVTICAGQSYTLPSGKIVNITGVYNDTLHYTSTGCDSLVTVLNLTVLPAGNTTDTSVTICAGQSYTLPSGKIVNTPGIYNDTLHYTSTGCDSLVTVLNLTVLPAGNTTDTSVTICAGQSYTLPSGKIVNTTGVYNDTVHYISTGCDSLVTVLNLTVLPAGNTTDTSVIICAGQSYTLPSGKIVNTPGVYNDTLHHTSTGCDSLITVLNLTVLPAASTVNTSATICAGQTYTLPSGKIVDTTGVYNDTLHYISTGCDSLVTVLNLTVLPAGNITDTSVTICAGQSYTLPSGKIVNTTGIYNDTLHYISTGCDSLVTVLNLTVLPAGNTTDTSVTICAGQSYTLPSGKIVNTTGVYNDTLHYISTGCDSLVTVLNLTVLPAASMVNTSATICAGYTYTLPSGKTVNAMGIYNDTVHYIYTGCDSLVTVLNLTVLPAASMVNTSATICAGHTYTLPSGKIVNTTGIYNDTLHYTSTGCDSLVTVLNLTVLPAGNITDTSVTICAGQSYTLPSGKTVNTTGVYNDTVHYISTGCDSLVTVLNLTVLPAGNTTDTSVIICAGQSYTLPTGKIVNATGVYNDTLHYTSTGCDSLVTVLNLTVLPAGNTTDTSVTICAGQSYTLPSGKTVNTTGVYNDTVHYTSTGCDSLVTVLNLTVLPASNITDTSVIICAGQSYTLPSGKIVNTTGVYNDTLHYISTGCDSLITVLNLTVLSAANIANTNATICAGQTYTLPSGKIVNTTGVYNDTLHYISTSCDSLVTVLNLTVLPAGNTTDTSVTICAGQSYTLPSGKTVNTTGVYNDTVHYASTGCDSLVTVLNLTVLPAGNTTDTSVIICAGQSYTLPTGKIVNTTGIYNDTLHYISTGCDSLVTVLTLTVLPAGNITDTSVIICAGQSYTLPTGKIVNTTGIYNDTLHYISTGCDSLVTVLNLTVLPAGNTTDTSVTICAGQSYTLPSGKIVNTTGVYNDTVHYTSTGCDSLITVLNLTVLSTASTVNTSATICASQTYTLPSGKIVNTTGVYNDTVHYISTGCDSLVTVLNLTVLPAGNTTDTSVTICAGQSYTLPSGKTVNTTGVYNDTLHHTSTGCDSLITVLNLTVLPAASTVNTIATICAGQTYTLPSGKTATATGVYNDTLFYHSTGCDSLITMLNLTVLSTASTVNTSATICASQTYTLPSGKIVNATGIYNDTVHYTSTGCDSLVTVLNLTVLPAGNTTDTSVTICAGQSYTLPSGKIVNTTGLYNDTLHYISTGCDSLVTELNLTVLPAANTVNTSATICAGQTYTLPSGKIVNTTGVYNDTLHYTSTGCDSLVTVFTLTVLPAGNTTDTSVTICAGQTYTLPSGKIVNTTGVYNDTVHYASTGCDSLVTTLNLTVLTLTVVDTTINICPGSTYTLTSGIVVNTPGVYSDTLHYVVTGCDSLVTTLHLTVGDTTNAVSVLASTDSVCTGSPVTFKAVTASSGPFVWFVNNVESGGGKTFTTGNLGNGDSVYCVAGKASSCSMPDTSAAVYITVDPLLTVKFNPDTVYITNNTPVQLTPIVSGTIAHYLWTPADGLSPADTVAQPYANPTNNTVYRVGVIATNGCSAEATVTVILRIPLVIPNAFTPNGDGHNDIFGIPAGAALILGEFDVFDRSGFRVFVTHDIGTGWDGNHNGIPQPPGTYVYMIKGTTPNGEPVLLKGTVVLIR